MGDFKYTSLILYNSKTKKITWSEGKKLSKPKKQKESKVDIIKNIRKLFELKKGNKAIKDKIISNFRHLFELEN